MRPSETADLTRFITLVGDIDLSTCVFSDAPDLRVPYEGGMLGVEHTRLYVEDSTLASGQQLYPQERLHFDIMDRAFKLFKERSDQFVYLVVSFKRPFNYRRADVERIAEDLSESVLLAITHLAPDDLVRVADWNAIRLLGKPLPEGIDSYNYTIHDKAGFECWGPSYGYMVPHLDILRISNVIAHKETKLASYRTVCTKVWLVIAIDTGLPSSHFVLSDDATQNIYTTQFEKVFVLNRHDTLILLNTQHPTA